MGSFLAGIWLVVVLAGRRLFISSPLDSFFGGQEWCFLAGLHLIVSFTSYPAKQGQ
jgi:hypothetical protein